MNSKLSKYKAIKRPTERGASDRPHQSPSGYNVKPFQFLRPPMAILQCLFESALRCCVCHYFGVGERALGVRSASPWKTGMRPLRWPSLGLVFAIFCIYSALAQLALIETDQHERFCAALAPSIAALPLVPALSLSLFVIPLMTLFDLDFF